MPFNKLSKRDTKTRYQPHNMVISLQQTILRALEGLVQNLDSGLDSWTGLWTDIWTRVHMRQLLTLYYLVPCQSV